MPPFLVPFCPFPPVCSFQVPFSYFPLSLYKLSVLRSRLTIPFIPLKPPFQSLSILFRPSKTLITLPVPFYLLSTPQPSFYSFPSSQNPFLTPSYPLPLSSISIPSVPPKTPFTFSSLSCLTPYYPFFMPSNPFPLPQHPVHAFLSHTPLPLLAYQFSMPFLSLRTLSPCFPIPFYLVSTPLPSFFPFPRY